MAKTKIAIFDLTGCQGCGFNLLSLNEELLDLVQDFEITNWRLLQKEKRKDFDIAFIEGAVTTEEQIKLLKKIRETSKILVAFGACAITGNIFAELPPAKRKKLAQKIYTRDYQLKAKFLEPVSKFVKVDKVIPGCPAEIEKVKEFLKELKKRQVVSKIKAVSPPEYLAKIEGHGTLRVDFKRKKVIFEVEESERLIEGLVLRKPYQQAPFITARICGICPIAHNLCSWKAIENALKITPPPEAVLFRQILLASQIIKSHLLHLFFLVLPEHANLTSSLELSKKYPAEFHLMLNIKRITDQIATTIGGGMLFPQNSTLAGFTKVPKQEKLLSIRENVWQVFDEAEDLVSLFTRLENPSFKVKHQFLTIKPRNGYPLYQGKLSNQSKLKERVRSDSGAKLVFWQGKPVKVGALARINLFQEHLNPQTKKIIKHLRLSFPSRNPFDNNLAQAIEIFHYLEEIVNLIEKANQLDLTRAKGKKQLPFSQKEVSGTAVIEAPRGLLLHQIKLDAKRKINDYKIITPTVINLASLKKEAKKLIKQAKVKTSKKEIEALIRAFDPCITCAVH